MMIMTTWQGVITIIMAMLGTMLTRFLPFLLFLLMFAVTAAMWRLGAERGDAA